jgi:hypothetical protein
MAYRDTPIDPTLRSLFGFLAGFLATLIFHQLTLAVLWSIGLAPFGPFSMAATPPFGIPAVFSLAFWGGVWGIVFALIESRFPPYPAYWPTAFLFGAILPSLVALMVVFPLKGRPLGGGWHPPLLVTAFLINGAWGLGTGWIFKRLSARWRGPGNTPVATNRSA